MLTPPSALVHHVSQFSRHGVGAKTAIFKLGRKAEIVTRTAASEQTSVLSIDLNEIRDQKKWAAKKGVDRSGRLQGPGTVITIHQLTKEACDIFRSRDVVAYLAQLYHIYIHGPRHRQSTLLPF